MVCMKTPHTITSVLAIIETMIARNLLLGLRPFKEPGTGPEAGRRGLTMFDWPARMKIFTGSVAWATENVAASRAASDRRRE
jgi:hypothetical protein